MMCNNLTFGFCMEGAEAPEVPKNLYDTPFYEVWITCA